MKLRLTRLWLNREFAKLWVGQTVSEFGSRITREGLPLTAVLTLGASPVQMGVLAAVATAPMLVVGLLAGAWVDRLPRRPILIASDVGRALVLATVPLAASLGVLGMPQVYIVAALAGVLTVFFDVAYRSFLPSLVERDELMEGNSKLGASSAVAEVGGPPLAGVLIQLLTAPIAILFDALSFVVSAVSVWLIRVTEPPHAPAEEPSLVREIREGIEVTVSDPTLRALLGSGATRAFFGAFFGTLYSLFAIRDLGIQPGPLGFLIGLGGVGALIGAVLVGPTVRRLGQGPAMVWTLFLGGVFGLCVPLAGWLTAYAVPLLAAAQLFGDGLLTIYLIVAISLRQTIVPHNLLGRATASVNVVLGGMTLVGSLIAGVLAERIGMRAALMLAMSGSILSVLWLLFSPVRRLREHTVPAEEVGGG